MSGDRGSGFRAGAGRRTQRGYLDNQLPPVIIGALMTLIAAGAASPSGPASNLPGVAVYLLAVLGLACFSWGMYLNAESLKYPESPFNKHVSPWLIGVIAVAALGHSAWTTFEGRYAALSYVFAAALVATLGHTLRLANRRKGGKRKQGLP